MQIEVDWKVLLNWVSGEFFVIYTLIGMCTFVLYILYVCDFSGFLWIYSSCIIGLLIYDSLNQLENDNFAAVIFKKKTWKKYECKIPRIQASLSHHKMILWEKFNLDLLFMHICTVDILFLSNHNIYKSLPGPCLWASDLLINRFY